MISRFDPWCSGLCTCPSKLTFNPYTGCDHHCIYCYASSYIPNHRTCRVKKHLFGTLRSELAKLRGEILAMSSSSDPYPTVEAELGLTRQCLKIISESNCRLEVFTKSDIVQRDVDLLEGILCMVSFTITTLDDELAKIIEPNAPAPSKRLAAIDALVAHEIPIAVRVDPVIPFLNDNTVSLIKTLSAAGVKHITSSTYKVKADNWMRLNQVVPQIAEKLSPLYFKSGEKVGGNRLLPKELRLKLMGRVRQAALASGMGFGVCREGLAELNTVSCDGSWLLPQIRGG